MPNSTGYSAIYKYQDDLLLEFLLTKLPSQMKEPENTQHNRPKWSQQLHSAVSIIFSDDGYLLLYI